MKRRPWWAIEMKAIHETNRAQNRESANRVGVASPTFRSPFLTGSEINQTQPRVDNESRCLRTDQMATDATGGGDRPLMRMMKC
jgi:hypothetical protein